MEFDSEERLQCVLIVILCVDLLFNAYLIIIHIFFIFNKKRIKNNKIIL